MSRHPDAAEAPPWHDLVFGLLALAGTAFALFSASRLSGAGRWFPLAVCAVMALAGLSMVGASGLKLLRDRPPRPRLRDGRAVKRGGGVGLAFLLTCVLTPWIGYFPAATLLLLTIPLVLDFRRWRVIAFTALVFEALVHLVFIEGFARQLPSGVLFS